MSEKKYNSRTKQPLLTAVKSLFFAIHHSKKRGLQMALPANISYHVLKLLEENLLSVLNINLNLFWNIKKCDLGVEMLLTSFTFKAPNVIVCEITEIKLGEN